MNYWWNVFKTVSLAAIIPILGICLLGVIYPTSPETVYLLSGPFLVIELFVGFGILSRGKRDPIATRRLLIMIAPILITIAISISTGDFSYFGIGILFSIILIVWFSWGRIPSAYRAAQKAIKRSNWEEAHEYLSQALQDRPEMWEVYYSRSIVNLQLGYFTNAIRDAQQAIELEPRYSGNYAALGNVYWSQTQFKEAKWEFDKALKIMSNNPAYLFNYGLATYYLGEFEETTRVFNQATHVRKVYPTMLLLMYYCMGRGFEAQSNLKKAHKAFTKMRKYAQHFGDLEKELKKQTRFPIYPHLQTTLQEIKKRLKEDARSNV